MGEQTGLPSEESEAAEEYLGKPGPRKFSRRTFMLGAAATAGALLVGKKFAEVADQAPQKIQELQGYPEPWSDDQCRALFADILHNIKTAKDLTERWVAKARIGRASLSFRSEMNYLDEVSKKKAWLRDPVNQSHQIAPYLTTPEYKQACEAYRQRLVRMQRLVGPERLANTLLVIRTAALPNERDFMLHELSLQAATDSEELRKDHGDDFAQRYDREILRQHPDMIHILREQYLLEVQNRGQNGYTTVVQDAISRFDVLSKQVTP